jgi:hypothetical protein
MSNDLNWVDKIKSEETPDPLLDVLLSVNNHLTRVWSLIEFIRRSFEHIPESEDEKKKSRIILAELLRSEIVLIHAILEDSLREILRFKLKHDIPDELLSSIPLIGISQGGQPKKFGLEDLAKHRAKTVDLIINLSIDEYLDKSSFSSSQGIASLFQKSGIDVNTLRIYFPSIDKMTTRRHQIVHRADRMGDVSKWQIPQVDPADVFDWMITVFFFVADIIFLVYSPSDGGEFEREFNNTENIKDLRVLLQQNLDKGGTTYKNELQDKL